MNTELTRQDVKKAFENHGIKVRVYQLFSGFPVRRYSVMFKIFMAGKVPHDQLKSIEIAASLGLVGREGERGGQFDKAKAHEMTCCKLR